VIGMNVATADAPSTSPTMSVPTSPP
jgi:hypothetical protein